MRAGINLASEPFRRDRSVLVISSALAIALTLSLAVLISLWLSDRSTTADQRALLAQLQRRLTAAQREQTAIDGTLRQPANAQVLDRSVLLNTMIYRKAISWTRLFSDLEKVTPSNVRIIAVRPQVDAQNHIFLDMTVGAECAGECRQHVVETGIVRCVRRDRSFQRGAAVANRSAVSLPAECELCSTILSCQAGPHRGRARKACCASWCWC